MNLFLIVFVCTALVFGFLNGFHDSANMVAAAIASRAMSPRIALTICAISNFIAPFLFGVAVANTIGNDVLTEKAVTVPVVEAALLAAIAWNLITWRLGIPSSSTHALIGGFVGAAIAGFGISTIRPAGMIRVSIGLFISPFLGLGLGWLVMRFVLAIGKNLSPSANYFFLRSQWLTSLALGLSYGTNDAQKTMGILAMGLVAFGVLPSFSVPTWVIITSAAAIAMGTALGGLRLIRTIGAGFFRVRPIHAFSSQVASTAVILGAALWGAPVSTTQVISSSLVGAGSAQRVNMVRWQVAYNIILTWLLTIPTTILMGAIFLGIIHLF